ncbi:hypothetical protein HYU50_00065 [Candidatus Woesearchaeota archaeon]|nr:hypothetical protein [Candidatus Woesearchaeota archaeon]
MRIHAVDNGPNFGSVITINQDFLFRGTDYVSFKKHVVDRSYWGSEDKVYGLSTFVASNIDGVINYCRGMPYGLSSRVAAIYDDDIVFRNIDGTYTYLGNRPILLAIAHEKYPLLSPADEGLVILGKISLDDIVIIKTERDLLNVLPLPNNLGTITLQEIKRRAGIFS